MRIPAIFLLMACLALAPGAFGQQMNGFQNALNVNDSAINAIFQQSSTPLPLQVATLTDSPLTINVLGAPNSPVVLLIAGGIANGSSVQFGAFSGPNTQIDLPDTGAPGYADQALVDGYAAPWPTTYTNAQGDFSLTTNYPACQFVNGVQVCVTAPTFEVTTQAVVVDNANPPFNISATGTVTASFVNGYQEFTFGPNSDDFDTYVFKDNFTFTYWGVTYTSVYISENSYIQFGTTSQLSLFPDPTVSSVNQGGPRIMSFFNDLDPTATSNEKVYVQQFIEDGKKKVKFVHKDIAEFGNATGGHGGEIVITELGEIAVFVSSTNATPSINTAVGISKGGHPTSSFQSTIFGRDLSADVANGPVSLGNNVPGFEVFDHGNFSGVNHPIDLIGQYLFNGSDVGPGIVYLPDPALPTNQFGYIIQ